MWVAATIGEPLGHVLALAWLALRERPISLTGLVRTAMMRKLFAA